MLHPLRTLRRAITTLLLSAVIGLTYAAGYAGLGDRYTGPNRTTRVVYEHDWQAAVFKPAAWAESAISGQRVTTETGPDWQPLVKPSA